MRLVLAALVLVLSAADAAQAYPEPALLFLRDGPAGSREDGVAEAERPNATEPSSRAVLPAEVPLRTARFLTDAATPHPPRLLGPAYVGVWLGASPYLNGNITVTLELVTSSGAQPIGTGQMRLDANASKAPEPTALVPPPTTDPAAAKRHIEQQLLPLVQPPPSLVYLGSLDLDVGPQDRIAVTFTLSPGASPAPAPVGAGASIQYNSTLQPSFAYLPWYAPDPVSVPMVTLEPTTSQAAPEPETAHPADAPNGTPAPVLSLGLVALGAAALALRRRR